MLILRRINSSHTLRLKQQTQQHSHLCTHHHPSHHAQLVCRVGALTAAGSSGAATQTLESVEYASAVKASTCAPPHNNQTAKHAPDRQGRLIRRQRGFALHDVESHVDKVHLHAGTGLRVESIPARLCIA
jgi:hypothetical protein